MGSTSATGSPADVLELFEGSTSRLHFDDGSSLGTNELVEDGRRLAAWLQREGFGQGDRVAIRLPNGADYIRLLLACAAGGFVAVSVNTRYSDDEVDDLVGRSGARLVSVPSSSSANPGGRSDSAWHVSDPIDRIVRRDEPFVVFTTSGTTSKPKMVLHLQRSIVDHAVDVAAGFGYTAHDTVMVVMPLCGTFGLASLTGAVASGAEIVVTEFEVARTADLIESMAVTCVNGSDDMFHRLLEHGGDLSSIRLGGYARFNTSLDGIVERAEQVGATLTGLYGMSEVQALYSLRDPGGDAADRARAGGTAVSPGAALRVLDGELQLRGPSLFAGYLAEGGDRVDHDLTARHHDDGWFRTGDLAESHDGGHSFEYLARMGDVLRLGGFLVSPAEIESALMDLEGVEAAQVVAVERPGGARPVGFVVLSDGVAEQHFDEASAIEACRRRLARYKVPVRVLVIDAFPSTPSANGTKIQKVKLRQLAEQEYR